MSSRFAVPSILIFSVVSFLCACASDPDPTGPAGTDPPAVDAGAAAADARPPTPGPDAAVDVGDGVDASVPTPLTECPGSPSIDRLQQWLASGEGVTIPATGSMLVPEGDHYVARIEFVGSDWHVAVVWLGNQFEASVDLSGSSGFSLTYAATDDFYVQLRPAAHWSGGDKYVALLPSTDGAVQTRTIAFDPSAWTTLPELGVPSYPFAEAVADARGLVFVGRTPNALEFRGLRVDGYEPPCL